MARSAVWCSVSASRSRVSISASEYQGLFGGAEGGGGGPSGGTDFEGMASIGDCRLGASAKLNTSGGAASASLRNESCPVVLVHIEEKSTSCCGKNVLIPKYTCYEVYIIPKEKDL